jgi:hypothetical protein
MLADNARHRIFLAIELKDFFFICLLLIKCAKINLLQTIMYQEIFYIEENLFKTLSIVTSTDHVV